MLVKRPSATVLGPVWGNKVPAAFRAGGVIGPFRLCCEDADVRPDSLGRDANPGHQSATAHWSHDGIELRNLLEEFKGHGPLAGDHVGMVVRRNERCSGLCLHRGGRRFAGLQVGRAAHDPAAIIFDCPAFYR